MSKCRKKPVEIDAIELVSLNSKLQLSDTAAVGEWARQYFDTDESMNEIFVFDIPPGTVTIQTLEGNMVANPGDYIIRGVQGEFYPCKPEIFEATYEKVEE